MRHICQVQPSKRAGGVIDTTLLHREICAEIENLSLLM